MKTLVFLQARFHSTRLPGKILKPIRGKTVLELICERLAGVEGAEGVLLVTGPKERNEPLLKEAERLHLPFFCGDEENLLDRFYQAAQHFALDAIVRVTGDCPLIDPGVIGQGMHVFQEGRYDVVCNARKRTYPDGLDFEIFTRTALEKSWKDQGGQGTSPTKYLLESSQFSHFDLSHSPNLSHIRLTLDYEEDFRLVEEIYQALYKEGEYFGLDAVLDFLKEHPELLSLNERFIQLDYGIRPELP